MSATTDGPANAMTSGLGDPSLVAPSALKLAVGAVAGSLLGWGNHRNLMPRLFEIPDEIRNFRSATDCRYRAS